MFPCLAQVFFSLNKRKDERAFFSQTPETVEEKKDFITALKNLGGEDAAEKISKLIRGSMFEDEVVVHGVEALRDIEDAPNRISSLIFLLFAEHDSRLKNGLIEGATHEDDVFEAIVHVGKTTKELGIEAAAYLQCWGRTYFPEKAQAAIDELDAFIQGRESRPVAGA